MAEAMSVPGRAYDPDAFGQRLAREGEETGTGLAREKHPVASLRVFTGPDEAEWLLYGGVRGGRQGKGWIEVYYEGIVQRDEGPTFGFWLMRIEGDNLETLAHQLGKQVRNSLKAGKEESYMIRSIEMRPLSVEGM